MALADGLAAFWNLQEASGARADAVGAETLTDNNTVTQNPGPSAVIPASAQFTRALSEYLSHVDDAILSSGDIDFTWAGWVYLDSKPAATQLSLMMKWGVNGGGDDREYGIVWDSTGVYTADGFAFIASADGIGENWIVASTFGAPTIGTWHFIVAYHDAANNLIGISVDAGAFDTFAFAGGSRNGVADLMFGRNDKANGLYHDGRLAAWGYWKRLLTAAEITWLYNGGKGRLYPFVHVAVPPFMASEEWLLNQICARVLGDAIATGGPSADYSINRLRAGAYPALSQNTDHRFVYAELYRLITNETLSAWRFMTEQELLSHVLANV